MTVWRPDLTPQNWGMSLTSKFRRKVKTSAENWAGLVGGFSTARYQNGIFRYDLKLGHFCLSCPNVAADFSAARVRLQSGLWWVYAKLRRSPNNTTEIPALPGVLKIGQTSKISFDRCPNFGDTGQPPDMGYDRSPQNRGVLTAEFSATKLGHGYFTGSTVCP